MTIGIIVAAFVSSNLAFAFGCWWRGRRYDEDLREAFNNGRRLGLETARRNELTRTLSPLTFIDGCRCFICSARRERTGARA